MKNEKLIRYQTVYLKRAISNSKFRLKTDECGIIELRIKPQKLDYNVYLFGLMGLIGLIFNYIQNYHILVYILSTAFLLIAVLAIILGKLRDENQYFKFDPDAQEIEYCTDLKDNKNTLSTDGSVRYWWEIHKYGGGERGRPSYSATLFADDNSNRPSAIVLQLNSYRRNDCNRFSKAVTRYLVETTNLKNIRIWEK